MKIVHLPIVLCAALAAGGLQAADDPTPTDAPVPAAGSGDAAPGADVPLVTVNGVTYSLDLFRMFYFERLQQTQTQDSPEVQQQAFNDFVNLVVTAQQAEALKLTERHDVQIGLEMQRLRLLSSIGVQTMVQDMKPTEDELKKGYEELVKQAKETQYQARHILVKDEAEAKQVIAELDKGGDFAELAKKHSTGPNAKAGGELGWFTTGQIDNKPFAEAVTKLKKGTYTKTPVNTKFGWHIIFLDDTRTPEPPTFDDAKPQLIAAYQRVKLGEKIGELRQAAKLDLNESVVKLKDAPAEGQADAKTEEKPEAKPEAKKK